jgi:hypothetical protein
VRSVMLMSAWPDDHDAFDPLIHGDHHGIAA